MTKIVDTTTSELTPSSSRLETDEILEMFEDPSGPVGHSLTESPFGGEPSEPSPHAAGQNALQIIVRPLGRGRYAAFLDGRLLCKSRAPLLAAARVLRKEGFPDATKLEMIHEGSAIVAMRATIGGSAGARVCEAGTPRFVPWRPERLPGNGPSACSVQRLDGKTGSSRGNAPRRRLRGFLKKKMRRT